MIVTKSMLNTHKKWRGKWPFNVDQVAVIKLNLGDTSAYAIVHKYNPYALSGILEKDFAPLEAAGVWAEEFSHMGTRARTLDEISPEQLKGEQELTPKIERKFVKKSLSPFFEFLDWQSEGVG